MGYIDIGKNIASARSPLAALINPYRTPAYPVFLALNETFFHTVSSVPLMQYAIASIAIATFFLTLTRKKIPRTLSCIISLFILLSINVFGWEKSLMTEGLATSWLLFLISLSLLLFDSLSLSLLVSFIILSAFGFLLRPMVIPIPFIILMFLIFHHTLKKNVQTSRLYITTVVCLFIPLFYILGNSVFHKYYSIQQVGDVDVFARILQFEIPVDAGSSYPFYTNIAKNFTYDPYNFHPFDILKGYDPDIYGKQYMPNDLRSFNKKVILSHPIAYVTHAVLDLPKAITDTSSYLRVDAPENLLSLHGVFFILQKISAYLTHEHFFIFLILPGAYVLYIRTKKFIWYLVSLLSAIVISQLLIGVLVVYVEYARLYSVTYPLMIAAILLTSFQIFQHFKQ